MLAFFTSCSSEEEYVSSPVTQESSAKVISPSQAAENAKIAMKTFFNGSARSNDNISIRSVIPISKRSLATRSSNQVEDTILYIVNFENNSGFAIIGADEASSPLYAISDEGSFEISDLDNEEVNLVFQGIVQDAVSHLSIDRDTTQTVSIYDLLDPKINNNVKRCYPKLSYDQSLIGYEAPYNKYCFTMLGDAAQTGCVPVAMEQIMSYHRWPQKYDDYEFNWRTMNFDNYEDIAKLLYFLGLRKNLDVTYHSLEQPASANMLLIIPTFKKFGYSVPYWFTSFTENENNTRLAIDKEPILISASCDIEDREGHCWVVDGYISLSEDPYNDACIPYAVYYHCVWGWRGNCNGYYFLSNGESFEGEPYFFGPSDTGGTTYSEYVYFNRSLLFLNNIKPIK